MGEALLAAEDKDLSAFVGQLGDQGFVLVFEEVEVGQFFGANIVREGGLGQIFEVFLLGRFFPEQGDNGILGGGKNQGLQAGVVLQFGTVFP